MLCCAVMTTRWMSLKRARRCDDERARHAREEEEIGYTSWVVLTSHEDVQATPIAQMLSAVVIFPAFQHRPCREPWPMTDHVRSPVAVQLHEGARVHSFETPGERQFPESEIMNIV